MKRYKVKQDYSSGQGGTYTAGSVVELDDELARHINVDSPGTLWPEDVPEPGIAAVKAAVADAARDVTESINRAVSPAKRPYNRRGAGGGE